MMSHYCKYITTFVTSIHCTVYFLHSQFSLLLHITNVIQFLPLAVLSN